MRVVGCALKLKRVIVLRVLGGCMGCVPMSSCVVVLCAYVVRNTDYPVLLWYVPSSDRVANELRRYGLGRPVISKVAACLRL